MGIVTEHRFQSRLTTVHLWPPLFQQYNGKPPNNKLNTYFFPEIPTTILFHFV